MDGFTINLLGRCFSILTFFCGATAATHFFTQANTSSKERYWSSCTINTYSPTPVKFYVQKFLNSYDSLPCVLVFHKLTITTWFHELGSRDYLQIICE